MRPLSQSSVASPAVLIANAGTLHLFHTAVELKRRGLLKRCVTSIFISQALLMKLPAALGRHFAVVTVNRRCAELDGHIDTRPFPELAHLAAVRLSIGEPSSWIEWRNRRFGRWLGARGFDGVDVVWGFDTSSCELFEAAKRQNVLCLLDMTIAYPALSDRIVSEYARTRPNMKELTKLQSAPGRLARRRREIELADMVMVGSSFVRESLIELGVHSSKIVVNPYGVDLEEFYPRCDSSLDEAIATSVRFLYVGWFSARKGVYDLLEAWERSGLGVQGNELVLAGGTRGDLSAWDGAVPQGVQIAGRIPHNQLSSVYRSADVFVFPSLFEGSARVINEALAAGLPIVTTPTACDEEIVIHGENGFRVEVGDVASLSGRMRQLAEDVGLRQSMAKASRHRARLFSWSEYGRRAAEACRLLFEKRFQNGLDGPPAAPSVSRQGGPGSRDAE